jgi:hypothetical protein
MTVKLPGVDLKQVKDYLANLGITVEVDFTVDRLYVSKIEFPIKIVLRPTGLILPKEEGALVLSPGESIEL